jgi:hypothetical protein
MTATPMTRTPTSAPEFPPGLGGRTGEDHAAGTLTVANAALRGGFVLLPRTLLHAPGLSRDAKLLYAVLLSYAWQQGSCFPGYERLQHDLQCSVNSVTKWMQELEGVRLVTRRKRGQGKTTVYTLLDPPTPPPGTGMGPGGSGQTPSFWESALSSEGQTPKICGSGLPNTAALEPQTLRPEYDSGGRDSEEHQPIQASRPAPPPPPTPPSTLAPTAPDSQEPPSAADDDALLLLVSQGVTRRIAQELVSIHSGEVIRQQVAWQPYRTQVKSPAGALVQAIRDAWPPPPAWAEAQQHASMVDRQTEEEASRREAEEARRREWEQKPPEERIAGRLQYWVLGQRRKGREPTETEVVAKRDELLAELDVSGGPRRPLTSDTTHG